jgi:phosphoesterase RecJ-like protein
MNYQQSDQILDKIKSAQKILINCHSRPDIDSLSSAFSLCEVLGGIGKDVTIVCPDPKIPEVDFLACSDNFNIVDFSQFNYISFNLFIILDSASPEVVTGKADIVLPIIDTIVIDHHKTNTGFGQLTLIDPKRSSTAELLYLVFSDWQIEINESLATSLLTGILGDTGAFEYHNTTPQTLRIAADLMAMGANKDEILLKIFRSKDIKLLKFWGEILEKMDLDESGKFTWCSIPYQDYEKHGLPQLARESASSLFSRMVAGTEFGIVIVEEEPKIVKVSFRARGDFDVSKIASALGGGGHSGAAGVTIRGKSVEQATQEILAAAKESLHV